MLVVPAAGQSMLAILAEELMVYDAVLSARIVRGDAGDITAIEDGIVAGRTLPSDLLRGMREIEFGGNLICETEGLLGIFQGALCAGRDVALRKADDGKGRPCDAVSFGFGFRAAAAQLGVERPPSRGPRCDAATEEEVTCPDGG